MNNVKVKFYNFISILRWNYIIKKRALEKYPKALF